MMTTTPLSLRNTDHTLHTTLYRRTAYHTPHVPPNERMRDKIASPLPGVFHLTLNFGFMDRDLERPRRQQLSVCNLKLDSAFFVLASQCIRWFLEVPIYLAPRVFESI